MPAGRVTAETVRAALRADTLLVSLMLVNNEIGAISDIAAIAELCRARGVLVHTDAAQAVGKLPLDVEQLGVDFLSLTAHKFYGPKGIGALYVRESARPKIAPIQFGGGHERGLRSGTLPTHQIVGLGMAAALARTEGKRRCGARARPGGAPVARARTHTGRHAQRASGAACSGTLNVSFPGVEGESLITGLADFALSSGSACSSATREPSYVLRSLGRSTELAQSSLRLSLGRFTTAADVDAAATAIRVRGRAPAHAGGHRSSPASRPPLTARAGGPAGSLLAAVPEPARAPVFPGAPRGLRLFRRGIARPMCARGGPESRPTGPRCVSSCKLPTGL